MCSMSFDFASHQVSSDNSSSLTIYFDKVEHLMATIHFYFATSDLAIHGRIGPEEQLLTCLSFGVKRSWNEYTPKRTIVEQTTIIPRKRNTLCDTLINDICRDFCQSIYVCFSRSIVSTFYSIVKQAMDRVSISLIIFGCIDSSLCSDRVCPTWRILKTKCLNVVSQFG